MVSLSTLSLPDSPLLPIVASQFTSALPSQHQLALLRRKGPVLAILLILATSLLFWSHSTSDHSLGNYPDDYSTNGRRLSLWRTDVAPTTFPQFVRRHVPAQTRLWITLSSAEFVDTGTASLQVFIKRLNQERDDLQKTALVILCLDDECQESEATWPKIAGLIDILPFRDTFFIDSDVYFLYDPYPTMLPLMQEYDIIAQENDAYDHFNTGWMWLRSDPRTVEAWKQVLEKDLVEVSRDQNRFNDELDTAQLRLWDDPTERPLRSSFETANGLRVHVLPDNLFRSHHFELDRLSADRHDALYLHLTCGDDAVTKTYVGKAQGFFLDVDGYYENPPPVLTVDESAFVGTREDVEQLLKVVLLIAHYTNRTFVPPTTGTVLPDFVRPIYSLFPLAHISAAFGIPIVEPNYIQHVVRRFSGASVKGVDEYWMSDEDKRRIEERLRKMKGLMEPAVIVVPSRYSVSPDFFLPPHQALVRERHRTGAHQAHQH
ncbi:hypothetical protein T439DRAFT_358457 [Meredithblackwellia eburnea MCA 4105]